MEPAQLALRGLCVTGEAVVLSDGLHAHRDVGVGLFEEGLGLKAGARLPEHKLADAGLAVKQDGQHQPMEMAVEVEHILPGLRVEVDRSHESLAPWRCVDVAVRLAQVQRLGLASMMAWLILLKRLPDDETAAIERHLREYDRLTEDLRVLERELARDALASAETKRLMTIPGVDMVVAVGLLAAIGRIARFTSPDRLVAFLGLNPSVHQSGNSPARYGRITKQGPCHARSLLVEAAWQAVRSPGPLRAFYERVRGRRGTHVAAVAVARKIAVIVWHLLTRDEDYAWVRPALPAKKLRDLELRSGQPARRGQRGAGYEYNLTKLRQEERQRGAQAEAAYKRLTEGWTKRGGWAPADASEEVRR